jgi:YggT family protein
MTLQAAIDRLDVANYVNALFLVYSLLIIAYVIASMAFSLSPRFGAARGVDTVFGFLRDVSEPYLRIFRRFLPMFGPFDLSPIVALIVLGLVNRIVVSLIAG